MYNRYKMDQKCIVFLFVWDVCVCVPMYLVWMCVLVEVCVCVRHLTVNILREDYIKR